MLKLICAAAAAGPKRSGTRHTNAALKGDGDQDNQERLIAEASGWGSGQLIVCYVHPDPIVLPPSPTLTGILDDMCCAAASDFIRESNMRESNCAKP
jgi:hypothetical protein